jgi:Protein of unknown function, DUF547
MKKILSILIIFISLNSNAQDIESFFSKADAFFKKNVASSKVDYQGIKTNPDAINDLALMIEKIDFTKENAITQKAFLINTYNILLIKGIVAKYPTKAPTDIAGLFDKTTYSISGKKYTLNDIENKLIRAKYNDPRVHFVLVCGANGCPPLINSAYLPETLEKQLDKQTKIALNNANFIKVNSSSKKVEVSQIFEWYNGDFVTKSQTLLDFINQYRDVKIDSKYKVSYYPYDWNLNKK